MTPEEKLLDAFIAMGIDYDHMTTTDSKSQILVQKKDGEQKDFMRYYFDAAGNFLRVEIGTIRTAAIIK